MRTVQKRGDAAAITHVLRIDCPSFHGTGGYRSDGLVRHRAVALTAVIPQFKLAGR